jgi:hypothetical protein
VIAMQLRDAPFGRYQRIKPATPETIEHTFAVLDKGKTKPSKAIALLLQHM